MRPFAMADPGSAPTPPVGCANLLFKNKFAINCMKMKAFEPRERGLRS